jgi:hypothetical protein
MGSSHIWSLNSLYVIGSLRNPLIPEFANELASLGIEAFASWYGAGEKADDAWKQYQQFRGLSFGQALKEAAAQHVFEFDKTHLDRCEGAVLYMPAGKSAHLELGYVIGTGKPGFIVFDEIPEDRWDVMYNFATEVFFSRSDFFEYLRRYRNVYQQRTYTQV